MRLSDYLDREKISPSAFAASLGMPASTITRILKGARRPSFGVLQRIAEKTNGEVSSPDDFSLEPVVRGDAA